MNDLIVNFSHAFNIDDSDMVRVIASEKGWQNTYRRIMLLGKDLPMFSELLKTNESVVAGCESTVWLHMMWHNNKLTLAASSDSKVVKGLIAIVLAGFNNKTQQQITDFDIESYLSSLNLLEQLSPSRGNGIKAIIDRITSFAEQRT